MVIENNWSYNNDTESTLFLKALYLLVQLFKDCVLVSHKNLDESIRRGSKNKIVYRDSTDSIIKLNLTLLRRKNLVQFGTKQIPKF